MDDSIDEQSRSFDHNPDPTQDPSSNNPNTCTLSSNEFYLERPYIQGWKKILPTSLTVDNNPPSSSTTDLGEVEPTLLSGCVNDWDYPSKIKSVSKYRADIGYSILNTSGLIDRKYKKNQKIVSSTGKIDEAQVEKIIQLLEDLALACEEDNAIGWDKDNARIWFFINSGGGDLAATVSVINKMNEIKARGIEIWTVVDGIGWSAAGLISSSGTYRFIKKNSSIFIHLPYFPNTSYLEAIHQLHSWVQWYIL